MRNDMYLTQGFQINNDSDPNNLAYFLFCGNNCMGELIVTTVNQSFASSFLPLEMPNISDAYINNQSITLILDEDALLLFSEGTYSTLTEEITLANETQNYSNITSSYAPSKIFLTPILYNAVIAPYDYGSSLTSSYGSLEVPNVSNAYSPDTDEGICWEASIASIGAYRTNTTAKTAVGLYNSLKSIYGGIPIGNTTWEGRAFSYYNLNYTYQSSGSTYETTKSRINNNRPIMASITNGTKSHAVVICGYQSAQGGYYYYQLMDPNVSSYVIIQIPFNSTNFTYASNSGTYTTWRYQFY